MSDDDTLIGIENSRYMVLCKSYAHYINPNCVNCKQCEENKKNIYEQTRSLRENIKKYNESGLNSQYNERKRLLSKDPYVKMLIEKKERKN